MTPLSSTSQTVLTDTWVKVTWEEFTAIACNPDYIDGRAYYDDGYMRLEMAPLGSGHGRYNSVASTVAILFSAVRNIRLVEFTNCSFRKTGMHECQPDIAFHIGGSFQFPPQDNAPTNVDEFGPPTLAVEVGATSISDDLGLKRLLYERLGVQEYWVVNVKEKIVTAFAVAEGRSGEIKTSQVLPGLEIALLEKALQRSQAEDDGIIARWLLQTFNASS